MKHVKSINQKAGRIEAYMAHEKAQAAGEDRDVVGLRTPPHEETGRTSRSGARWSSCRAGRWTTAAGTAGLCQPVERDIFDCHISCFWPAHVPDQLNHAAGLDRQVRLGPEGLAQARRGLPVADRRTGHEPASRLALVGLLALSASRARAPASAQETATWYIPTYTQEMLVWDEASERIIDRIQMEHFIPNEVLLNESRDRLYVLDATAEHIDIVDVPARRVVDTFTLSSGSTTVRIDNYAVHPSDERMLLVVKRSTKGRDRYTVEGPFILEYDLRTKQVTDTLDPGPTAAT